MSQNQRSVLVAVLTLVTILSGFTATTPTPVVAASQAILSSGPLTRVEISTDLNCAVDYAGDTSPEFFGDTACATLVAVGGTLYGPPSSRRADSPRRGRRSQKSANRL